MQSENIREYELVRGEMLTVKDCITKYVGFVLGGSGVAIYGMAMLGTKTDTGGSSSLAFVSSALSIIVSFVLLVLFYKFYSHNRFAGYCKLLNHERHITVDESQEKSFLAWEIAVEMDRYSNIENGKLSLLGLVDSVSLADEFDKEKLKRLLGEYTGHDPKIDKKKRMKGLSILFNAIFKKIQTRSWAFPPLIVSLFFCLSVGFLLVGFYAVAASYFRDNNYSIIKIIVIVVTTLAQLHLWARYLGNLHSLMNGSETIDAFFWKFIPVRALFLNNYGIIPEYIYADELLDEMLNKMDAKKAGRKK